MCYILSSRTSECDCIGKWSFTEVTLMKKCLWTGLPPNLADVVARKENVEVEGGMYEGQRGVWVRSRGEGNHRKPKRQP